MGHGRILLPKDKLTVGLINPTGGFPIAMRASLISVIMLPKTGDDAEVPYTSENAPSTAILKGP